MCLFSTTNVPLIADRDIICYKILMKTRLFSPYITPCRGVSVYPYLLRFFNKPFKAKGIRDVRYFIGSLYQVNGGFIHTYSTEEIAIDKINLCDINHIFECIIPKGTTYYISDNCQEYASTEIKFKKKII